MSVARYEFVEKEIRSMSLVKALVLISAALTIWGVAVV